LGTALWLNGGSDVGNPDEKNSQLITTYYLKKKNNQPAARARAQGSTWRCRYHANSTLVQWCNAVEAVAMEQTVKPVATDNLRQEKIQKMSTID